MDPESDEEKSFCESQTGQFCFQPMLRFASDASIDPGKCQTKVNYQKILLVTSLIIYPSKENKSLEMGNLFQTLLSNWLHFNFKTKIKNPSNQRCWSTKNSATDIVSSKKREEDKARIWTWPTALFSYCYICFYFLFFSTFIYCFLFIYFFYHLSTL